ncbi:MAG: PEP-CTERM sorting domain-containing protein [Acidobacteria bacterium]|nr:PEP-CTERM sorting domain-containing protein [Acidobacteriota bacterium]
MDNGTTVDNNEYIDDWRKDGDLGSFDVRNPNGTPTSENPVPEPSSFALLGGSIILAGLLRRR